MTVRAITRRAGMLPVIGLASLVFASSAGAYVYWVGAHGIGRVNLNGRRVLPSFVPFTPDGQGLALSGSYLYAGANNELIGRASVRGGGFKPEFIRILEPGQTTPSYVDEAGNSLTVEGQYVYWASAHERVGRATLDGSVVEPGFIRAESPVGSVAVDAGHIYWSSGREIGRADLDGSNVEPAFIEVPGVPAQSIAVSGGYLYWAGDYGHSIGRVGTDGSKPIPRFISGIRLDSLGELAVAGPYIFWGGPNDATRTTMSWLGRAKLNGTQVRHNFVLLPTTLEGGLAADGLGPRGLPVPHPASKH